jgi:hypothetical protein
MPEAGVAGKENEKRQFPALAGLVYIDCRTFVIKYKEAGWALTTNPTKIIVRVNNIFFIFTCFLKF